MDDAITALRARRAASASWPARCGSPHWRVSATADADEAPFLDSCRRRGSRRRPQSERAGRHSPRGVQRRRREALAPPCARADTPAPAPCAAGSRRSSHRRSRASPPATPPASRTPSRACARAPRTRRPWTRVTGAMKPDEIIGPPGPRGEPLPAHGPLARAPGARSSTGRRTQAAPRRRCIRSGNACARTCAGTTASASPAEAASCWSCPTSAGAASRAPPSVCARARRLCRSRTTRRDFVFALAHYDFVDANAAEMLAALETSVRRARAVHEPVTWS